MSTDDPVAIIGAGMAGLTAGLTLSRAGRHSILFEASDRIGGCCATIAHEGRDFEPAASVIIGASLLDDVLAPLGAAVAHLLTPMQPIVRAVWPDGQFDLVSPLQALRESLVTWAPEDVARMATFVDRFTRIAHVLPAALWDWKMGKGRDRITLGRLVPCIVTSYESLLGRTFAHPPLRQLFEAFSDFYAGVPAAAAPSILGIMPALAISEGCYAVPGGIQRLPEHLAQRLIRTGAEIRCNEPIHRLILRGDTVCGVESPAGVTRVSGVVAACDIRTTLGFLPPRPRFYLARLRIAALRPSVSCISIIGMEHADSQLPPITWALPQTDARAQTAPHGGQPNWRLLPLAVVTCGPGSAGDRVLRIGGAVLGRPRTGWTTISNTLADQLVHTVEHAGLRVKLTQAPVWTPADYEAHLGLPGGAAFSFAASKWQLGPARYGPRTSVCNLVVAGQSCFPGFGIPFAAFSGRLAATVLTKAMT